MSLIRTRHDSFRRYEPGTIFRERDGYWRVLFCETRPARDTGCFGGLPSYDITLEKLTVEEELVWQVMSC